MIELDHLSYSSISSYLMCPRAWHFHYVEKTPVKTATALVFGSAFHNAIESYLTQRALDGVNADGEPLDGSDLALAWMMEWGTAVERNGVDNIEWGTDTEESLSNQGYSMLADEEVINTLNGLTPLVTDDQIHIEDYVTLHVPGVPIPVVGYIDIITSDGIPGDFKTSSRRWYDSRAESELQPAFYLAALNQAGYTGNPDRRFRHYVFVKTKTPQCQVIETTRSVGDVLWIAELIRSVWGAIEAGAFPMNPDTWKCSPKYCEYWELCRGRYG